MESLAKHIDWLLALATVSVINMLAPAVTLREKRVREREGEAEQDACCLKTKQRWLYIALYFKAESA